MMHTATPSDRKSARSEDDKMWDPRELACPQTIDEDALELLPLFARELERALGSFRAAVSMQDVAMAKKICHRIKGSAATYGYRRFADALAEIELALEEQCMRLDAAQPVIAETVRLICASVQDDVGTLPH